MFGRREAQTPKLLDLASSDGQMAYAGGLLASGMNFYSIARESSTWNWTPSVSLSAYIFLLAHTMDALENVSSNKRTLYM